MGDGHFVVSRPSSLYLASVHFDWYKLRVRLHWKDQDFQWRNFEIIINFKFLQILTVISILALTTRNPVYLISTTDARRVWPVSRGCLLLPSTWSYLRICRRSVLPYTRFWNCFLNYDNLTFYTLLTSLFCIQTIFIEILDVLVS
jgi:hypothetical protein